LGYYDDIDMARKIRKIILFGVLAIGLVLAAKIVYFELYKTCGDCGDPDRFRGVSEIEVSEIEFSEINGEYPDLAIRYSKSTGALPPAYYREHILTITTDGTGRISGEYVTRDYEKVLATTPVNISKEQLKKLITISANIGKQSAETEPVCPGASTKSIKIIQNDKVLLDRDDASCGGAFAEESLMDLFIELEKLLTK